MNQAGHVLQRPPKSLELRPEKGMERWGLLQISATGDWRGRGEEMGGAPALPAAGNCRGEGGQ